MDELFLFMPVFPKLLLAFVRSDFMSLSFLSTRHRSASCFSVYKKSDSLARYNIVLPSRK